MRGVLHGRQAMQHASLHLHTVAGAAAQAVQPSSQPSERVLQLLMCSQAESSEQGLLAVKRTASTAMQSGWQAGHQRLLMKFPLHLGH